MVCDHVTPCTFPWTMARFDWVVVPTVSGQGLHRLDTPSILVEELSRSMAYGPKLLDDVPGHVVKLCAKGENGEPIWKHFTTRTGKDARHEDFTSFVTTKPLEGLGCSVAALRRACQDDHDAMAAIDDATNLGQGHRSDLPDNVREVDRAYGNSADQARRRLRKERPDLYERVRARELSPHAAMVLAGLRPATLTLRLTEPERVAAAILRKAESDPIVAQALEILADRHPCAHCGN